MGEMFMGKRKSSAQRAMEFFDNAYLRDVAIDDIDKSSALYAEIELFFEKYLNENPKTPNNKTIYCLVFSVIEAYGVCDIWYFYEKMKPYRLYSLGYFIELHGVEKGQSMYTEYRRLKRGQLPIKDRVDRYLTRKVMTERLSGMTITDDIREELVSLFSAYDYDRFHEQDHIISDLIIHFMPNFKERFDTIKANYDNIYSDEYYIARFGNDWEKIKKDVVDRLRNNATRTFKSTIEYWTRLGYDEKDAITHRNRYQAETSKRSLEVQGDSPRCRSVEFWENKGYSSEESRDIVRNIQRRNKSFFVEKYGETVGSRKFQEMIDNRNDTWFSKDEDTRKEINKTRGTTFLEYVELYGEERATEIIRSRFTNTSRSSISKESNEFFEYLDGCLPDELSSKSITGYKGKEHCIRTNDSFYLVDYIIDDVIIEYHGSFWHCNPLWYDADYVHPIYNLTASAKWEMDATKYQRLVEYGYKVKIVWCNDVKNNFDKTLNECLELILNETTIPTTY